MLVWRLGFLVFIQVVQVRSLGGESRSHFTPPLAAASPGSARSTMCRHALPQGMICSRDFPFPAELKAFFSCSSLPLLQDPLVSQAALSLLGSWIVRVWLLSGNSCLVCIEQLSPSIALFPGLSQEITLTVHGGLSKAQQPHLSFCSVPVHKVINQTRTAGIFTMETGLRGGVEAPGNS